MSDLVISLDEFAELVGVTAETMRVHLRDLLRDVPVQPEWLIERGDRGRAYKIEAEGAVRWWQEKREADELASSDRKSRLTQMRLELVGDKAEGSEALSLSGRQRREEYAAAIEGMKYRKALGELVEVVAVERVLIPATVELRQQLQRIPAEFGISAGLDNVQREQLEALIERAVGSFVDTVTADGAFREA